MCASALIFLELRPLSCVGMIATLNSFGYKPPQTEKQPLI